MNESSYSMEEQSDSSVKRPYRRVTEQDKANLFREVFENRMKITKAAKQLGLNLSTAKFLIKRYKRDHKILKRPKEYPETTATLSPAQQFPSVSGFQPFYYVYYNRTMVPQGGQQIQMPYSLCYPSF